MTADAESVLVPAAPVWELVRRRQAQWGYSDDQMCDFLDWHPQVVDTGPWMLRPTAERLLRRLAEPRRGDAVSAGLAVPPNQQEGSRMQAVGQVPPKGRAAWAGCANGTT